MAEESDMSSLTVVPQSDTSPSTWREWLQQHGPKLMLFARQQTRSHEDAEDVLQDAFVKLVDKIRKGEFVGGSEAWQAYLYTTIRRLAIDLSRRDSRRRKREDVVSTGDEIDAGCVVHPWFESDRSDGEIRDQLEEKLKELPAKFAEVIVMKIWGEKTFAQIGDALEISPNTAASRYRYGLEALQKSLAGARRRGDLSI